MNDEYQEPKLMQRANRGALSDMESYILNEPHHVNTVQCVPYGTLLLRIEISLMQNSNMSDDVMMSYSQLLEE